MNFKIFKLEVKLNIVICVFKLKNHIRDLLKQRNIF